MQQSSLAGAVAAEPTMVGTFFCCRSGSTRPDGGTDAGSALAATDVERSPLHAASSSDSAAARTMHDASATPAHSGGDGLTRVALGHRLLEADRLRPLLEPQPLGRMTGDAIEQGGQ